MKQGCVLYRSKYGSTKRYAAWLAEALGCDCRDIKGVRAKTLQTCDFVVLCGAVYASGIAGVKPFKRLMKKMQGKQFAVLCVGASPYSERAIAAVRARNLGEYPAVPLFYARGAWDERVMSAKDRLLCGMLKKYVTKKDPATYEPWEEALAGAIGKQCDWTDRAYLEALIAHLNAPVP